MSDSNLTPKERFQKIDADLSRLKNNRNTVPLEVLQTKYAKPYNKLLADIREYAEWFLQEYLQVLSPYLLPEKKEANDWLRQKVAQIMREERSIGGKFAEGTFALLNDCNRDTFEVKVWEISERLASEAYRPYAQMVA